MQDDTPSPEDEEAYEDFVESFQQEPQDEDEPDRENDFVDVDSRLRPSKIRRFVAEHRRKVSERKQRIAEIKKAQLEDEQTFKRLGIKRWEERKKEKRTPATFPPVTSMSGALKRQISVGTILLVIIAFAAGVAGGSYFVSRPSENQIISTFTNVITVPTTITLTPTGAESGVSSSVATSLAQIQTSTSQRPKWISSSANVISWSQAGSYVGQSKTVEGTIVYTGQSGSNVFLDFHYPYQGYFYIYIPASASGNFKFSSASFYRNKEVRVTGTIVLYKGSPEIIVNSPSQIEVAYMGFNYP
jgi:hypothetical protein